MARLNQPSIATKGIQSHLEETKADHNNVGYYVFELCMIAKAPLTVIGRIFGVTTTTAKKWRSQYNEENKK